MAVIAYRGGRALTLASFVAFAATGVAVGAPETSNVAQATPLVIKPKVLDAGRAAELIHRLFPDVRVSRDDRTGSVVVFGSQRRLDAVRSTFDALDTKGPSTAAAQAFVLRVADPARLTATLHALYPTARIAAGPQRTIVVAAPSQQLTEITAIVQAVDVAPPAPTSAPRAAQSVTLVAARPADVARIVEGMVPGLRARATAQNVVFAGTPDAVERAKRLAEQLDIPPATVRYSQTYRLKYVDAGSVAALVSRTLPEVRTTVEPGLSAFSALATTTEHQRISDAVAQLDVAGSRAAAAGLPISQPGRSAGPLVAPNGQQIEVVTLRAATPGVANAASTSAADIAGAITQALQPVAPELHVSIMPNNPSQLILAGTAEAIQLGKQLIAQLDVAQKLVVLDTVILEVDATSAKNLGLSLANNGTLLVPGITQSFTEQTPAPAPGGSTIPLQGLQPLARSPLAFGLQLSLLVQRGEARVLAEPRITTISGRTATIRSGENISILTTTGGASGVTPTTQIQTFQTGVTLDITPVINAGNFITVALHPVINSLSSTNSSGIPQISTRDTQTTVAMQEEQTLVIGGLISEGSTRQETRIPFLGDLPLVGKAFRSTTTSGQRNELIITVTPHILNPGDVSTAPAHARLGIPTAQPLPTLPPSAELPPSRPRGIGGVLRPHASRHSPAASAAVATPTIVVPLGAAPPVAAPTPTPGPSASPRPGSFTLATPAAFGIPSATPRPTPTAFAQANTYTFGAAPQNNFAGPSDPIQIYYATFGPTVVKNNTQVTVSAITSSNVSKVTIGYQNSTTQLSTTGSAGQWQATYTFTTAGLPGGQVQVPLALTASKTDGTTSSITIPVSVAP